MNMILKMDFYVLAQLYIFMSKNVGQRKKITATHIKVSKMMKMQYKKITRQF